MRRTVAIVAMATLVAGTLFAMPALARLADPLFPHEKHARLFPFQCATCHAGVADPGRALWPEPAACASCHDGVVKPRVEWTPRTTSRATNLRFTHDAHRNAVAARRPADTLLAGGRTCRACHVEQGARPMAVQRFVLPQCLDCHGLREPHMDNPASACATCHVPLTEARALTREDIAQFPKPASHRAGNFLTGGHGRLARVPGSHPSTPAIAATCATCHARNFCTTCHVGATESPVIMALAVDDRVPARTRTPPPSHTLEFRQRHGNEANARPQSCATCHERSTCLECHRPDGGRETRYHPQNFLTRHPSAAFGRQTSCSDCHNPAQFCQSCHQQAGVVAKSRIGPRGYHDAFRGFSLGHGQAARQSLESCASCHAERDCAACHSAVSGGFRFNPHGPGFNAARMRARNPAMCIACHGRNIPD